MSDENKCPICMMDYDINNRKAFILMCGHSACSVCINFYKNAQRALECGKCSKITQSANFENISLYRNTQRNNVQQSKPLPKPSKEEFEIYIRKKDNRSKFPILVKKSMKIKELKDKIYDQENIESDSYDLSSTQAMIDYNKTLEDYGITSTRTLSMITIFKGGI